MSKRHQFAIGIHFDFHARPGMTVAELYRPDSIEQMLDRVRPDFVQCDTKGHAGLSSYPTDVGFRADRIDHDMLALWRELTAKRGIALYAHHSGLYDRKAIEEHPEWAVVDENGVRSEDYISVFSDYAKELLVPQLLELAGKYKLDGVWVDGECWGLKTDYSEHARKAYFAKTGKPLPRSEDVDFENYRSFVKDAFKQYVSYYRDCVKALYPDFEITSNWMYSSYMPERADVALDYLSGDYSPTDSVNGARVAARCFDAQNMTWDLMAWGQSTVPVSWVADNRHNKPAVQLCQEAAVTLALGGGFQFFDILYGNGTYVQEWSIEEWGKVADFVRERKPYCFRTEPVMEIAVLHPYNLPGNANDVYKPGSTHLKSWVSALQSTGFSTGILFENSTDEALAAYPAILWPQGSALTPNLERRLLKYAENGGTLICDLEAARRLTDVFPELEGEPKDCIVFPDCDKRLAALPTRAFCVSPQENDGLYYTKAHYLSDACTAYRCTSYGKGKVLGFFFDLGGAYAKNRSIDILDHITKALACAGVKQTVTVSHRPFVDVTLRKQGDALMLNLINTLGPHENANYRTYDFVPKLCDVAVRIRLDRRPRAITLCPDGLSLPFTWQESEAVFTVPALEIHSIAKIEF